MSLITLTSDLGTRDHYVAVMKGELLMEIPGATLIDISHEIEPFNIIHAAFVIKNCYRHFPDGTIHIISVNMFHESQMTFVIVKQEDQFFIGPDNGLFGLIWDDVIPKEIFRIDEPASNFAGSFPIKVYSEVASHIIKEKPLTEISSPIRTFRIGSWGKPVISNTYIRGTIIYFDRFGNAMVNIHRDEFEKVAKGRKFVVIFKRYADIESFKTHYGEVDESEKLCFFNSSGYLEIAINKGNAKNLLNLSQGDNVQIDFQS